MALTGSVTTGAYTCSDGGTRTVICSWTATQSIANNTTTISWEIKAGGTYSGYVQVSELKLTIDGTVVYSRASSTHTNCYNGTSLKTGSTTVNHASDGTKSVTIKIEAGIYNWAINKNGSKTFTLDTIARASSITSATNKTLGNACSIAWTPASSSFTYKIKFALNNWSYTTGTISPNTTSSYTYTGYTLPLTVANQLPNATTGTMTAYLYTYNGSSQVGSTASKTFTVTVPTSVVPTISSVSATIVNSNSVIDGWGVAVAGYTKVKVSASASGAYSSTISSFKITGSYSTTQNGTSLSYTGGVISSSGSKTFTITATDSRSRTSSSSTTSAITFYAYSKPSVSSFTASRSSSDQTKMIVKGNWSFSSVNSKNSATGTLYYKKSTASSWTNYGTISKNTSTTLTVDFALDASYNFKLVVTDALSNSAQDEAFVSTMEVLLDFRAGGKGLGIGKICESDAMEVSLDAKFYGNIYINDVTLEEYIQSLIG